MPQREEDTQTIDREEVKEPSMYNVILLNDNYTTWDFVMYTLIKIFNKSEDEAMAITKNVHEQGRGIAGKYIIDIAVTKSQHANDLAYQNGHPLKTIVEQE